MGNSSSDCIPPCDCSRCETRYRNVCTGGMGSCDCTKCKNRDVCFEDGRCDCSKCRRKFARQ